MFSQKNSGWVAQPVRALNSNRKVASSMPTHPWHNALLCPWKRHLTLLSHGTAQWIRAQQAIARLSVPSLVPELGIRRG